MRIIRQIDLPIFEIKIFLDEEDGGSIESNLTKDCHNSIYPANSAFWNAEMTALETMILACAGNGIDVLSTGFIDSIQFTVDEMNKEYK